MNHLCVDCNRVATHANPHGTAIGVGQERTQPST